jgi:hypothetical protein
MTFAEPSRTIELRVADRGKSGPGDGIAGEYGRMPIGDSPATDETEAKIGRVASSQAILHGRYG